VAQVSNNKDPDNLARVKVTFPWLGEKIESDWARIASPGAGNKVGLHWLPEVGDEVLVAFEHGDIHWPYVLAGLWNGKDAPPNNTSNAVGGDGKVKLRTLQSPQSSKLVISDEAQKRFVQISCVADSPGIKLDYDNKSVEILSNGTINIKGTQGKITVEGQDLEIKSSTNLKLSASANVEISAGANMTVKGVQTSVEGSAQMAVKGAMTSLEGSGIAEIKGALVKIN